MHIYTYICIYIYVNIGINRAGGPPGWSARLLYPDEDGCLYRFLHLFLTITYTYVHTQKDESIKDT
jgi:hypothetical protein